MSEIRNLTRNGETFYPLTHIEGVLDPEDNYIGHYEENPEWVRVIADHESRILAGIKTDGSVEWSVGVPQPIKNYISENLNSWISGKVDKEEGKSLIDSDYAGSIEYVENPELIDVKTDSEGKILEATRTDGIKVFSAGVEFGGNIINSINDPENRSEITIDIFEKIISYRKENGIKVENVGFETKSLKAESISLSENAASDLANALDKLGYTANNPADWSNSKFIEIPIPKVCAIVNIGTDSQAEAKGLDIPTYIQFWDKSGNYFKKPILLNAQGSSSLSYHIKNQAIDINDGSEIKFGNWPAFDSFHIKKYFIDVFRGQCVVGYWLTEQVYRTRQYGERKPWDYLNKFDSHSSSNGDFSKDFDSGAMAHPDGFPVHLFFNGKDSGVYTFCVKKARGNYYMKKDKQKQIILDGVLGDIFFTANGDFSVIGEIGQYEHNDKNVWADFEIRNPKISKDIDGNKYDGDNPTEPSDDYITTKNAIKRLSTAITVTLAEQTDEAQKSKFAEFFNIPFLIDYELISQVIFHYDGYRKNWIWCCWDGNLWCPTSYDMDSIFGQHWNGASYVSGSTSTILGTSDGIPTGENLLKKLYRTELIQRYKELRDKEIFDVNNIISLLEKWVNCCGYDNMKNDIENIVTSPYLENGSIVIDDEDNPILVPNTPSYRDDSKTYAYPPQEGGWYNSIQRVENWLIARLSTLDSYYNYSS